MIVSKERPFDSTPLSCQCFARSSTWSRRNARLFLKIYQTTNDEVSIEYFFKNIFNYFTYALQDENEPLVY